MGSIVSISPSWGGGEDMAHNMFKMRCKFKFETFLIHGFIEKRRLGKVGYP